MEVSYIENYKGVKIYQYDDKYIATPYTYTIYTDIPYFYSIEKKDLKDIKFKIDEIINEHIKKYQNLD